jgi:CRISPR type III-associated protein (TIGR04423 family)
MNNYILKEINTLHTIPNYKFTGYYWVSDQDKPVMLFDEVFPKDKFEKGINPFCIEALLYSETEQVSIHIQHTGHYLIHAYDLKQLAGLEVVEKTYLPHKLENVEKVKFKQVWEEVPLYVSGDESMPTLKPSALIFSGFNY